MSESPNSGPKTILIVDTNEPARILLKAYLNRLGHPNIEESADSMEALRLIMSAAQDHAPYSMVFMEWTMPEMDAVEFIHATRQMRSFAHFPIIVLAEEYDHAKWNSVMNAGANAYLIKPVSEETLIEVMIKAQPPAPQKSE
ncbi:MAG: response regulator [Bdellovibrionaceae bacterium]|nr:response regulator [Pseudobdellovibrionaceae bacterium]